MGASDNNRAKGCLDDGRSTKRAMGYSSFSFLFLPIRFANRLFAFLSVYLQEEVEESI